jgi:heme/copper-type cytochrome/quinol oxidase subunit 3
VTSLTHEATDYTVVEEEPPEILGRNLHTAAHLLASATVFFFLAFLFGYFYLRSQNNHGLWRPKHTDPPLVLGTLVMALTVASALLVRLGLQDHRAGRRPQWRVKGGLALAAGVAALVVQIVQWTTMGFGPTHGGYASIFFGWTGFNLLFVVCTLFWLENILATSLRYGKIPSGAPAPGEASGDPGRPGHDIADPLSLVRPGLEAISFYWTFFAGMGVLMWVILYLI